MKLIEILTEASSLSPILNRYPYGSKLIHYIYKILNKNGGLDQTNITNQPSHDIKFIDVTKKFLSNNKIHKSLSVYNSLIYFIKRNGTVAASNSQLNYNILLINGNKGAILFKQPTHIEIINQKDTTTISPYVTGSIFLELLSSIGKIDTVLLLNLNYQNSYETMQNRDSLLYEYKYFGKKLLIRLLPFLNNILSEVLKDLENQYKSRPIAKFKAQIDELNILKDYIPSVGDVKTNNISYGWQNLVFDSFNDTIFYYNPNLNAEDRLNDRFLRNYEEMVGSIGHTAIFHTFMEFFKNRLRSVST